MTTSTSTTTSTKSAPWAVRAALWVAGWAYVGALGSWLGDASTSQVGTWLAVGTGCLAASGAWGAARAAKQSRPAR